MAIRGWPATSSKIERGLILVLIRRDESSEDGQWSALPREKGLSLFDLR